MNIPKAHGCAVGFFLCKVQFSVHQVMHQEIAADTDDQIAVYSTDNRCMIFSTALLLPKSTRATQGVAVLTLRKKAALDFAAPVAGSNIKTESRYRAKAIPAAGAVLKAEEAPQQQIALEL